MRAHNLAMNSFQKQWNVNPLCSITKFISVVSLSLDLHDKKMELSREYRFQKVVSNTISVNLCFPLTFLCRNTLYGDKHNAEYMYI